MSPSTRNTTYYIVKHFTAIEPVRIDIGQPSNSSGVYITTLYNNKNIVNAYNLPYSTIL